MSNVKETFLYKNQLNKKYCKHAAIITGDSKDNVNVQVTAVTNRDKVKFLCMQWCIMNSHGFLLFLLHDYQWHMMHVLIPGKDN